MKKVKNVLLIDFGSTYTKLTAVDVENEKILATAAAYTTVQTDINEGLNEGLRKIREKIGEKEFDSCYACSSAAGGLRMITSGLVPELTSEAARLASLGAGAKVVGIYSFELTDSDLEEIKQKTRHFAKRQLTWFRRQTDGTWIDMTGENAVSAAEKIKKDLIEKGII